MSSTGLGSHCASSNAALSNFMLAIRDKPACVIVRRAAHLFSLQAHKNGHDDELSQFALRVLVQALHVGHPEHGLREKIHALMVLLREYGNEQECNLWPLFRMTLGRTLVGEIDSDFGSIACDLFGRGFVMDVVGIASMGDCITKPGRFQMAVALKQNQKNEACHDDHQTSILNVCCKP